MKVAVIGAAGYAGGELLRILLEHPHISTVEAISQSQAGKPIDSVHEDLFHYDLAFQDAPSTNVHVTLLCGDHGHSAQIHEKYNLDRISDRIIDLAQDNRDGSNGFVYGLPEIYFEQIAGARKVANPGCFATAIQLALLPLAEQNLLQKPVHITAITGSTGAGQKLQKTSHFSQRQQNLSVYKAFDHQHLPEIQRGLSALQTQSPLAPLHFVPMRGPFTRGILASIVTECERSAADIFSFYKNFYSGRKGTFVHVTEDEINLKSVVNTNHARLQIQKHDGLLHIVSCIDNLLKGASGQAVQNLNIMMGWPVDAGLKFKALAF